MRGIRRRRGAQASARPDLWSGRAPARSDRHPRIRSLLPSASANGATTTDPPFWMTSEVYDRIRGTVGAAKAEQGGPLGGNLSTGLVSEFLHDVGGTCDASSYSPDVATLNGVFRHDWGPRDVSLLGFVHSHPRGSPRPSMGDAGYAAQLLDALPGLDRLLLPIVDSCADGLDFACRGFVADRAPTAVSALRRASCVVLPEAPPQRKVDHKTLLRVRDAYDLEAMASTRVVLVGAGGAAAYAEHLARCGVGELVLIDPDTVERCNIATQQTRLSECGSLKVAALARRLVDLNSEIRVLTIASRIEDLSRTEVRQVLHRPLFPDDTAFPALTLLCGFTDDFWAQAETARVALEEGVPLLTAQVYAHGHGAEIVFVAPGHTSACHRCVLGARYDAYLHGYRNDVTSAASPLYATERLNATKSMLSLAMIHALNPDADPGHPGASRLRSLFERVRDKNLVQIRLAPDIGDTLSITTFDRTFAGGDRTRIVCDETVWLPQAPAGAPDPCGDCGGVGDLTRLRHTTIPPLRTS